MGLVKLPAHSSLQHCLEMIRHTPTSERRGLKTMLLMIAWHIWKERNACVFRGKMPRPDDVLQAIKLDLAQWILAEATCIEQGMPP